MRVAISSVVCVSITLMAIGLIISCQERAIQTMEVQHDHGSNQGQVSEKGIGGPLNLKWRLFLPTPTEHPEQWESGIYGFSADLGFTEAQLGYGHTTAEDFFHWPWGSPTTIEIRYSWPRRAAIPEWFWDEFAAPIDYLNDLIRGWNYWIDYGIELVPSSAYLDRGNALALGVHDGISGLYIVEPNEPLYYELGFDGSATYIGWTYWHIEIDAQNHPVITEFEIYLNADKVDFLRRNDPPYDCMCPPREDCHDGTVLSRPCRLHFRSLFLHELMHGLGVGHCANEDGPCPDCPGQRAVMCEGFHWQYNSDTDCGGYNDQLELQVDIDPLRFLYDTF